MRLTTGTAVLAVAGLAALATGCSSSSSSAPVAPVHKPKAVIKQVAAKPLTLRQQLVKAQRATLAAHTASWRFRWSVNLTAQASQKATSAENVNPLQTSAGWVDFDHNRAIENDAASLHSAQPQVPFGVALQLGDQAFLAPRASAVNGGVWATAGLASCSNVDTFVDVLSYTTGKIGVMRNVRSAGEKFTVYKLKQDLGRALADSCSKTERASAKHFMGDLLDEYVWVNSEGRIVRQRVVLDPGSVQVPGVDASEVRNMTYVLELGSFGVSPVIPPHPTKG